jgi:transposase InsO family protein
MCQVMGVTRSGYYNYLKTKDKKSNKKQELKKLIKKLFYRSRSTYGIRRIRKALENEGLLVNRKTIASIMKEEKLTPITIKKYKATTNSKHKLPIHPNLIKELEIDDINQVWVSDITYVKTEEGWLYLAAILDLYSKDIVGYAMSDRINKELVISALNYAILKHNPNHGIILHSDRGVQYASNAYQKLLKDNKMVCSMSAKGNPYENAAAESFNATIKKELIHPHGTYETREEARRDIFEYIELFYNKERIHSSIDYKIPYQFRLEQLTNLRLATI